MRARPRISIGSDGTWPPRPPSTELLPVVVLLVLPLILLAANQSWIWDNPDFNDSTVYVAYFRHYLEFKWPFIANYKMSRLPWVLPGVLVYKILPSYIAHHVLFLVFLWAATLFVYFLTKDRFGTRAAFVAAAALATSTSWHIYPSYHNQSGATYFTAALLLFDRPRRWPPLVRAMIASGVFALALTTNAVLTTFIPMFAWHAYATLRAPRSPLRILARVLAGIAGAAGALALVGAINVGLGGPFLFFMEQVRYTLGIDAIRGLSAHPVSWIAKNLHLFPVLALPCIVWVGSIVLIVARTILRRFDWAMVQVVGYVMTLGMAGFTHARGLGTLEIFNLFQPFLAPMFLAIAAIIGKGLGRSDRPPGPGFFFLVAGLFVAPLSIFGASLTHLATLIGQKWPDAASGAPTAFVLVGLAVVVAFFLRRRARLTALVLAGALGLTNALCTSGSQPAHTYQAGATCPFRSETFRALLEVDDMLTDLDPENGSRWRSDGAPLLEQAFDGSGWCGQLPLGLVSNAVLLTHYFYTSKELLGSFADLPPMKKYTLAAMSPANMEATLAAIAGEIPATNALRLRVERTFPHSTFTLYMRNYDVVPR